MDETYGSFTGGVLTIAGTSILGAIPVPSSSLYGWLMLAGIAVSVVFWARLARRDDRLLLVYVAALVGAFLGAKVAYLLAEGWRDFGQPDVWLRLATGKSILGALPGGYLGVELAKKWVGYRGVTGDWFALIAPVSIAVGRVGCALHGCCLGRVWAVSWFTFSDSAGRARWPAVPVEIGFNLVMVAVFFYLRSRGRRWQRGAATQLGEPPRPDAGAAGGWAGQHFHIYLVCYGLFRFAHEFLRDTPRVGFGLSGYQCIALAVAGFGVVAFVRRARLGSQVQVVQG